MQKPPETFNVRASPNQSKTNPTICTIWIHIRYADNRATFSTGQTCDYASFDKATQTVLKRPDLNVMIAEFFRRAYALHKEMLIAEQPVDVKKIAIALQNKAPVPPPIPTVAECIARMAEREKERLDVGEIVQRTYWKNLRWGEDFRLFLLAVLGKKAPLTDVKAAHAKQMVRWLQQHRGLSRNVAQSTVVYARAILGWAVDNDWLLKNPFQSFRRKLDPIERVTLTETEIARFFTVPLESKALRDVRDVFCFLLLTGMSFADCEGLRAKHFELDGQGGFIIRKARRKTGQFAVIPLRPQAIAIIEHHHPAWPNLPTTDEPVLPMQRNAPLNRAIKQIAAFAGVEKSVSTKVARNSMATYLLNKGVPLPSIGSVLGHASTTTTLTFYAKTSPEKVVNDLQDFDYQLNKQ